jgi:hypothetical protein
MRTRLAHLLLPFLGRERERCRESVAIWYLFQHRPGWRSDAAIGKTLVASSMIDRVAADTVFGPSAWGPNGVQEAGCCATAIRGATTSGWRPLSTWQKGEKHHG